jgi:cyclic pyranopterin monophosphate synthase
MSRFPSVVSRVVCRCRCTDHSGQSVTDDRAARRNNRGDDERDIGPPRAYPRPVDNGSLTHVDATGAARMVDVTNKEATTRRAIAAGTVHTTVDVISLLRSDGLPKGDALAVARIAGIMGAKKTPDLIPLCHPIAIGGVELSLELAADHVDITAIVRTADRTGVEMEALTAVACAGLALIDMIKAVDPAATIDDVRVLRKEGGKTGTWERPA